MEKTTELTKVKGIGPKTCEVLNKSDIFQVGDILLKFPRDYILFPDICLPQELNEDTFVDGKIYAILSRVDKSISVRSTRRAGFTVASVKLSGIEFVWFRANYIKHQVEYGKSYVFYGKLRKKGRQLTMEQPSVYTVENYHQMIGCYLPVYTLPKEIKGKSYEKIIRTILSDEELFLDYLPNKLRSAYGLCEYNYSIKQMHFPDSMEALTEARRRIVFDEFFLFIMAMRYQRSRQEKEQNHFQCKDFAYVNSLIAKLPFTLTEGQLNSLTDIQNDIAGPYAMQRLLQGDVGSGKTIIAFLMMALMSHNGFQSAIMAPTEVLASQHFETFCKYKQKFEIEAPIVLLTGQMKAKEKRDAYKIISESPNAIIVGTHALIQEKTDYNNLSLVITDEQHRFGVKQRETFMEKGISPHILVMSATPIPRTLAIILYGDMDLSVIDHVPSERLPIKNCVVGTKFRPKAYEHIRKEVESGHQAYIICPLVEASENSEGENVIEYSKVVAEALGDDIRVDYLHGKMKGSQKVAVMEAFLRNEIQVLVSTTVIEVGVNVPNATVMMIENADRFGLAQLHQVRGRVGRGDAQSYCIFVNTSTTDTAKKRLEILNHSTDGFYIASQDLQLRGPGDFFGIRQSGDLGFQIADVYQDANELQQASDAVSQILEEDPELLLPENQKLRHEMNSYMSQQLDKMNL